MNTKQLKAAKFEAERFLERANEALKKSETEITYGCAEGSAVRRSSMDLTRSLAKLRKSVFGE
jgi:hypothetical protein